MCAEVCAQVCVCHSTRVEVREQVLGVASLYHMSSGAGTQVSEFRFESKHLSLPSHLTGPRILHFKMFSQTLLSKATHGVGRRFIFSLDR